MMRLTRSKSGAMPTANMTVEDQVKAIEREAEQQILRQQKAAEKKAEAKKAAEQQTAEQKAAKAETPQQAAASDDLVVDQSFDFDVQSASSSDTSSMDLDPSPPPPQPPSTLSLLQAASAAASPSITFPFNRILPKAAVFLRCQATHVFFHPVQPVQPRPFQPPILSLSLSVSLPADSHAIAHVAAPCPQCVPACATAAEAFCRRRCPFCMVPMPQLPDGRHVCLTASCWFSRCVVETGTGAAEAAWREVWRVMGNRYFFVGPWEDVLSFSNDLDRDGDDKWRGGDFTV